MKTSCWLVKGKRLLWPLFGLVAFEILFSAPVSGYAISSKALNVSITTPENGQQVPVSKNLLISGISSANGTNNCEVSVIINNVKPYQKAIGIGIPSHLTGHISNDYSTWVYRLSFPYPPLKLGENTITAKITCAANNQAGLNTVNVTGVQ